MWFTRLAVVLLFGFQETHAFQWTAALQDGADVYACVGDNVTFNWGYTLGHGEVVEDIKWYYHHGNASRESLAITAEGHFFSMSTNFSDRIGHVQEAGLSLTSLTTMDKGRYSVTVTVLQGSSSAAYNHTATLIIADDPLVLENETLWARQERVAVYDNTTGQLHVCLSCGKYVITGQPPVSVEWTFPLGEKQLISTHTNGTFFLTLPNPVEGGNYTCRLFPKLPPVSCLPQNASVLRSSSVSVDEVKMRMSLLEAEQEMMKTEKQSLQVDVKEDNRKLSELAETVQQVKNYIKEKDSNKVRFFARSIGSFLYKGQPVKFGNVIMNEGNAYNATTGVFKAPFNGTYFFILSAYEQNGHGLDISLYNGENILCTLTAPLRTLISCEATAYLSQGENVLCSCSYCNGDQLLLPTYSSFIGFSLDSDIQTEM